MNTLAMGGDKMKGIYMDDPSQRDQLNEWEKETLMKFSKKMKDKSKPFPCIPATIGFSLNQLRYCFIGDPRETTTIHELAKILSTYSEISREIGNYTSLIVFFETSEDLKATYTVQDYEQLFWQHLNSLNRMDHMDWPIEIPNDPHHPYWEFCYNGEKYFMYCATPAHEKRQSRHFDGMMLAITPHWVLQEFNQLPTRAKGITKQIRKRLLKYDSIGVHPDLNSFGSKNNYEWKQYYLRDDNTTLSKCPFHQANNFPKLEKN